MYAEKAYVDTAIQKTDILLERFNTLEQEMRNKLESGASNEIQDLKNELNMLKINQAEPTPRTVKEEVSPTESHDQKKVEEEE